VTEPLVHHWDLATRADRRATWQLVADTDRFNRLSGFDFRYALEDAPGVAGQPQAVGSLRHAGLTLRWHEHPVEFCEPTSLRIVRDYLNGPLRRAVHRFELSDRAEGGTRLQVWAEFYPRHAALRQLVRMDLAVSFRGKYADGLDEMVRVLDGHAASPAAQLPAEPVIARQAEEERWLSAGLGQVRDAGIRGHLQHWFGHHANAEQGRLLPLKWARRWQVLPRQLLGALLQASHAGVLEPRWELLCPACRQPSTVPPVLDLLRPQGHCQACNVRYDASLADSVALTFAVAERLQRADGVIACLSSPSRLAHRVWQTRLELDAEHSWELDLLPGAYRLRCWPDLDEVPLQVRKSTSEAPLPRVATVLIGPLALQPPVLRLAAGRVTLHLRHKAPAPVQVMLERVAEEPQVLAAGLVLEWAEVLAELPDGMRLTGLPVAAFEGPLLAVRVLRGGEAAVEAALAWVRTWPPRSLQRAGSWLLAAMEHPEALARVVHGLAGAPWLAAAVGWGRVLEVGHAPQRMAAGGVLPELVALAQQAEPGQVLTTAEAIHRLVPMPGLHARTMPEQRAEYVVEDRRRAPLSPPARRTQPLQPGELVDGQFRLGERLGEGGFGVVHAAVDARRGRELVLKLLRPELAESPLQVQRFLDEGRLAARLDHPHVVRVFDWGMGEDGRLFLALERLRGRELADLLRQGATLSPRRAIGLVCQALDGLAEAHRHGLVHRDIKPANLFVVDEGTSSESVKLIDFGIALDLTGQVRRLDADGELVGTPSYLSPEQVAGLPADHRSDLYAMAIVLYRCLTGLLPFRGDTDLARALARLQGLPLPLDEAATQPLPAGLVEVVHRALSRDPDQRHSSAQSFARDLKAVMALATA
jgi:hypothetical protein